MAFCSNDVGCGHTCGRQEGHGGDCDCGLCKRSSSQKPMAIFYAVWRDGKYYHTYSRAGNSGWVDKVEDAKIWTRRGPALGMITKLSTPSIGPRLNATKSPAVPELVEFLVTEVRVVDQTTRVTATQVLKQRKDSSRRDAKHQQDLIDAERAVAQAQAKLKKLQEEG